MGRIEKSVEIKVPPEKVWEMLALDRMPEWKDGCKSVMFTSKVYTPEDKYRVDVTARFVDHHAKLIMTIADSLENEKITYHTSYLFVHRLDLTYVLEPVEEGTKLKYMVNYKMIGWGIPGKVRFKLMMMLSGKEIERSLGELKSILEK